MLFSKKENFAATKFPALGFCEKGERGLQKWLDSLPKMDHLNLAKQLLDAGKAIETADCSLSQRVAILEIIKETVLYASGGLKYAHNTDRNQQLELVLHQRFHACYGLLFINAGMRLLQAELATADKVPTQDGKHSEYLKYAGDFMAKTIVASKQAYTAVPARCWFALHHAFRYQFENNIANNDFESTYKAAATLGCAIPEKLDAHQCEELFSTAKACANKIKIFLSQQEQATFCVDSTVDVEPQFIPEGDKQECITDKHIYFCFKDLVVEFLSNNKTALLGEHLQQSLLQRAGRLEQRNQVSNDISICIGLTKLHHYLAGTASFKDFILEYANIQDDENRFERGKKSEKSDKDIWGSAYKSDWDSGVNIESIEFDLHSAKQEAASSSMDAVQAKSLQVVNTSANGICLHGKRQEYFNLKPGALIGLTDSNETEYSKGGCWKIAIVRWKQQTSTQCKFGAEIIGHNPRPAGIKIKHSKHSSEFLPALMLEGISTDDDVVGAEQVLFANAGLQGRRAAVLACEGKQRHIVFNKCLCRSKEFNSYSYKETGDR